MGVKKKSAKNGQEKVERGKIEKALDKSPINYFSDLFIVAMVLCWIAVLTIMLIFAIYSTVRLADNSIWPDLANLVAIPLSCGGAIWMIKNSVQHAIANNKGQEARMDFPKVNADGEDEGFEQELDMGTRYVDVADEISSDDEAEEEAAG